MQGNKIVSIGDNVAVSSTENQDVSIEANGRIKGSFRVRMYKGAELELRLVPQIITLSGSTVVKVRKTIPALTGKAYIDGDDDSFVWDIDEPVYKGETIRIAATNANGTYTYDYRVDFTIVYD